MVRMFVVHSVNEYGDWKQAYDAFDEERRTMGVTGHAVHRSLEDPNEVTIWHDFATREAGEAFVSSERLKEVMQSAGVVGEPRIWFTREG